MSGMHQSVSFVLGELEGRMFYVWPHSFHNAPEQREMPAVQNHFHLQQELHYVRRGSCTMIVEGEVLELSEGEYVLLGRNAEHAYQQVSADFSRVGLMFELSSGGSPLCELRWLRGDRQGGRQVGELLFAMERELGQRKSGYFYYVQALLCQLMLEFQRTLSAPREDRAGEQPDRPETYWPVILDQYFIEATRTGGSCGELAALLGVSVRQLNRILQRQYGCSFREKLQHTRIRAATLLLRRTKKSVEEIARQVGYSCASSFCAGFRAETGVSPAAYRKGKDEGHRTEKTDKI